MGYRKIENLYRNKEILLFKQCHALEKVDGSSSHVKYDSTTDNLTFFSGCAKHDQFVALFNQEELLTKFRKNAEDFPRNKITIYGEVYGGKIQGRSKTYGPDMKFIAFEVLINDDWMSVPVAHRFAEKFGFEFVHYEIIDTTEEAINAAMMADSVQAVRNGMGPGHMREGVVLRPLIELIHPNGGRIICKHKRPEFSERVHTPKINDPEAMKLLEDAKEIVEEWCVPMRLVHVLDALKASGVVTDPDMKDTNKIIAGMLEDVTREAAGEIVDSKEMRKALSQKTVVLFKNWLKNQK